MSDPGLMVEESSRLSILLVEGDPLSAKDAIEALRGHEVVLAKTLDEVLDLSLQVGLNQRRRFDYILSSVHMPESEGKEQQAMASAILSIAMGEDTPVCFVTRAKDEISIVALDQDAVSEAVFGNDHSGDVQNLKPSDRKSVKGGKKTGEVWMQALQMLQNCSARPVSVTINMKDLTRLFGDMVPQMPKADKKPRG